jgi:hypothetical protein
MPIQTAWPSPGPGQARPDQLRVMHDPTLHTIASDYICSPTCGVNSPSTNPQDFYHTRRLDWPDGVCQAHAVLGLGVGGSLEDKEVVPRLRPQSQ